MNHLQMDEQQHKTISIFEICTENASSLPPRSCTVRISVDGKLIHDNKVVEDPFQGSEDLMRHKWYLNEWCDSKSKPNTVDEIHKENERQRLNDQKAKTASTKLISYPTTLLERLDLNIDYFRDTKSLHIDIWEAENKIDNGFDIHQIIWESLELPSLWNRGLTPPTNLDPIRVMVRRIVTTHQCNGHPWESRTISEALPLRVLLLVARDLTKTSRNTYRDIKSYLAQVHLLQLKRSLEPLWMLPKVELHIVRPGSFEALQEYLNQEDPGYFDLVHLDVHGNIEDDPRNSYLLFASNNIEIRTLERKLATEVATLFQKRGVKTVVTNGCWTAAVYERREANLSRIFVENGISYVSAMSHKISTTAVNLFCSGFYRAFIMSGLKFAEATSLGRMALRENKSREFEDLKQPRDLQDWCVPITYVCAHGKPFYGNRYNPTWLVATTLGRFCARFRNLKQYVGQHLTPFLSIFYDPELSPGVYPDSPRSPPDSRSIRSATESPFSSPALSRSTSDAGSKKNGNRALPNIDIGILDFERHLVYYRIMYLHGPSCGENRQTLRSLSLFWCSSNFVGRAIHIPAQEFIKTMPDAIFLEWNRSDPYRKKNMKLDEVETLFMNPPARGIAFIIEDIHSLYPDDEEEFLNTEQEDMIRLGRNRFQNFLREKIFALDGNLWYLIITGKNDENWWNSQNDINVGGEAFARDNPLQYTPWISPAFN